MTIADQISRLDRAVEAFISTLASLRAELFLVRINGWSTRDIAAHLIGWNRYVVRGSRQIMRGELPFYDIDPGENYCRVNAALLREYPSQDRQELVAELRVSAKELQQFLDLLSPEVWQRDFGVRHGGSLVTIQNTVDELIQDYDHHRRQIDGWEPPPVA